MRIQPLLLPFLLVSLGVLAGEPARAAPYEAREPIPAAVYMPREGKRVACFITINSTDEKEVFTRYLNPDEWDLVELTAPTANGSKSGWFDEACKKTVKCDVNVVSGHFAGAFFGSSGYRLGLNELENHSCARDCEGILEHPREAYLFGCNTLATKQNDNRFPSPEGYYRHLVDDEGYAPEVARRVTDDRYSAFGQDNRGKMQRAFAGVPYLFGFSSASPLGAHVRGKLDDYMKKLGDYTAHFDAIAAGGKSAKTAPNVLLPTALKGTAITQCAGLDPNDPEYAFHLQICALFDKRIPLRDRLASVEPMLTSPKVLMLLPSIQNFIRQNIREIKSDHAALLARLQANRNARETLLETVKAVESPVTKVEWMRFAHLMGWIERADLVAVVYELVDSAFSGGSFQPDMGDIVCSLNVRGVDRLDFSKVVEKLKIYHFSTASAAHAMRCTGLARYPEFRAKVAEVYRGRTFRSNGETANLATIFTDMAPLLDPTEADRELLARLREACEKFPLGGSIPSCGRALAKLGAADEATAAYLVALLKAGNPSLQMNYAEAYAAVTVGLDAIETAMLDAYLDPKHPYWYALERYFVARPIRGEANRARMLDYLTKRPEDGRRPDEMIYALRQMKMTPTAVDAVFRAMRARRGILITPKVFLGFLHLAESSGADAGYVDKLFDAHHTVALTNDEDLAAFYETMKLPRVRAALKASPAARKTVCEIMGTAKRNLGFDDYGDAVARTVPVKTCDEVLAE